MSSRLVVPLAYVHKMPRYRGCGGHRGGDEVGAAAFALAAFEVAVARAGAALAGLQLVRVHRQAHRAAGLAPFKAAELRRIQKIIEDHEQQLMEAWNEEFRR